MKCPNCSNEVPDTANVCGYCGQRLKSAAPPPQPVYAKPAAKKVTAPAAQSGVWWRFGALLLGAVLMSISELIYIFRGLLAASLDILGLILLAFAAFAYWRNEQRRLGGFIGAIGLGLLFTFMYFFL